MLNNNTDKDNILSADSQNTNQDNERLENAKKVLKERKNK